ncbi:MAG: hypothetical protein AAGB51_13035 [Planctomycetota bacterium]
MKRVILCVGCLLLVADTGEAVAGVVLGDETPVDHPMIGFESFAEGDGVASLDFGLLAGTVTGQSQRMSSIIEGTDGDGAIAGEGERFWKLMGGTTTIDFGGVQLDGFGFTYSDLEWTTLSVRVDGVEVAALSGSNPNRTDTFAYLAENGESFGEVSFTWIGNQGDGVGFDALWVSPHSVPVPAVGLLPLAMFARRRRQPR